MKPYYEDGSVVLYHGDCREVLPGLERAALVLTDPPYGLSWSGGTWAKHPKYADASRWDVRCPDAFISSVIDAGESAVVWGGNLYSLPPCRGYLAWRKTNAVPTMADFELAWTTRDAPARIWYGHNNFDHEHPTQKPLALMEWTLGFFADAPGVVLDPFAGSGTTLVAAKNLGRRAIGIEIEERYCEIAAKRLCQEVLPLDGGYRREG